MSFKVDSKVIVKNKSILIPAIIRKAEGSKLWQIEYVDIEDRKPTGHFASGMKSQQMREPKGDEFPEEKDNTNVEILFVDVNSSSKEENKFAWKPSIEVVQGNKG
jgi:hypothetical protein